MERTIKKTFLTFLLVLFSFSVWAESEKIENRGKGKTIVVMDAILENINNNSFIVVQTQLSSLLNKYTSFTVVDNKTDSLRKSEIKKSAGAAYDENVMLEAGKNLSAQFLCIPVLEKVSKFYSITVSVLEVETGRVLAKENIQSAESVLAKNIDKLFCTIFSDDLHFDFTKMERNQLMHESEEEQSADELERIAIEIGKDIEKRKALMSDALRDNANNLDEIGTEAMRIAMDAEISRLQAEQENYERRAKQKREDEERAKKAEEEARKYSDEQRLRAKKLQEQLELLQNKMKAEKKDEVLPDDIILLIETQKKALDRIIMDNLESLINQKEISEKEFSEKEEEIRHRYDDRSQYMSFYDEDGELNAKGRKAVKDDIAYERKKFESALKVDSATIIGKTSQAEKDLRSAISSEEKQLSSHTFSANTLLDDNNVTIRVGEYNGSKDSWPLDIVFDFEGVEIWQGRCYVSYQDVTGEKPVQFKPDDDGRLEYQKFQEKIIVYDNMFRENLPLINVEVKYKVKPASVLKNPVVIRNKNNGGEFIFYLPPEDSCYDVTVLSYNISRAEDGTVKNISSQGVNKERCVDCSIDLRYHNWNSEQAWSIYNSGTKKIIGKETREQKSQESKEKTQEKTAELKNKVEKGWDSIKNNTYGNSMSEKLFDLSFCLVPESIESGGEKVAGGGFGTFKVMFPLNDFFMAGCRLDAGKIYGSGFVDLMTEINAHAYITEKIALSAYTGVGLINIVNPELEVGFAFNYVLPKDMTIHVDYTALFTGFSPKNVNHVISAGVSFPIPDVVTDFVTDIAGRVF